MQSKHLIYLGFQLDKKFLMSFVFLHNGCFAFLNIAWEFSENLFVFLFVFPVGFLFSLCNFFPFSLFFFLSLSLTLCPRHLLDFLQMLLQFSDVVQNIGNLTKRVYYYENGRRPFTFSWNFSFWAEKFFETVF